MAISHVAFLMYPSSDLPKSKAFYRDVLGLTPTDVDLEFWVEYDVAGATFGIGTFEQCGKPGTAQSLSLEVADLDGFITTLAGRGAEATTPHELATCRISMVSDPDGNKVWLHEKKPSA